MTGSLENNSTHGSLIVVDGVYSMEGDIADIPELSRIARKHGAALAVDDAHALGVLGPKGDGTGAHFGMQAEVDIIAGTFSKSLASVGGFLAADESVIHYLKHNSRQFIFTASLPPANTAGVLAALEVMQLEPERRPALWRNAKRLQDGFRSLGFDIGPTQTPIVPVLVGQLDKTFLFWRKLFDAGVFTNPVCPPAVPANECRLRTPRHGDALRSADRLCPRGIRTHRQGAGGHLSTAPVVRRVETAKDLARFIDLPYRLHRRDLNWVPPFRAEVKKLHDRKHNPFIQHAEADYLLAERDGEFVGRIAAIHNHLIKVFHKDTVGFFGFWECINDFQGGGRAVRYGRRLGQGARARYAARTDVLLGQ